MEYGLEEVSIRLVKERRLVSDKKVESVEAAVEVIQEILDDMDRECVVVLNLQADMRPVNFSVASIGAMNHALVSPADLLKTSILSNASGMIMVHNHPSGNVKPSIEDIQITDKMKQCCDLLDIRFFDHLIVGSGENRVFSFAEKDMLPAKELSLTSDIEDIHLKPEKNHYRKMFR